MFYLEHLNQIMSFHKNAHYVGDVSKKVSLCINLFFGTVLQVPQSFYPLVSRYSGDSRFLSSGVQVFRTGIRASQYLCAQVSEVTLDCILKVSPSSSALPSAPLYQKFIIVNS